ncbi:MAG TPA: DUF4407 domain-containing protein [Bacteroidaceae bacterium]|nr:DUF4407 domain-containing protein [Bacteroidaceae bacterium]
MATINNIGFFTKLGCILIGWNSKILKECGEASHRTLKRYISAIIILTIIWGTIGFCFAERYIGLTSLTGKIAVACIFITMIICIERYIILNVGKLGIMGFVRGVLAFLMAVLGSTVFDQIIFKHDIEVKMKEIRTEQINQEIPRRMAYLDNDIKRVTSLIDSIGKENVKIYALLQKNPVIEATDVSTTTKQVGVDETGKPITEKITNVNKRHVENPLSGQAKSNEAALEQYKKQLDEFQKEKINVATNVRNEYEKAQTGFLEELSALFRVLTENTIALIFYIFLFAFLMFLELLVVMSKGGDGACDYDLIVEHQLRIKRETLKKTEDGLLLKP